MDQYKYNHFRKIVTVLNQYEIEPIVVGTASVELLSHLDFDAVMIPLVIDVKWMYDTHKIIEIMGNLNFKPGVGDDVMLFSDGIITLDLLSYEEYEAYTGFQLAVMEDLHKNQKPNYKIMPATYTIEVLDALLRLPNRSDELKKQDIAMMKYLEAHGYILDRLNLNVVESAEINNTLEYRFAQPNDNEQIEEILRVNRPLDWPILLKRIKNARKKRVRKYSNIEIVMTMNGNVQGHAMVELGVLMSDDESDGWIVGNVLDLTFNGDLKLAGAIEQFLIILEDTLITSTPAVLLTAENKFKKLEAYGYEMVKFSDIKLPAGFNSNDYMVKELFQGVLDSVSGQITFAKNESGPSDY